MVQVDPQCEAAKRVTIHGLRDRGLEVSISMYTRLRHEVRTYGLLLLLLNSTSSLAYFLVLSFVYLYLVFALLNQLVIRQFSVHVRI